MEALIDFDIVAYSSAASAENDSVEVAKERVDQMVHNILEATFADTYRGFLSGAANFRYEIYPEYKANRKDTPDPRWRNACKEHLVLEWKAEVTDSCEADDAMGFNQTCDTIICTIDKDLDMIPGMHYSWPIIRKGSIVREGKIYSVSEIEALRSFYRSLLVGDRTDNIFGVVGIGKVKAAQIIDPCETEKEMFQCVSDLYEGDLDRLLINGDCLWIQRKEGERWSQSLDTKKLFVV